MTDMVPIRVMRNTREMLKDIGSKGETYDDIISKLLEKVSSIDIETNLLKELEQIEAKTGDSKVLKSINNIRELIKG